LTIGKSKTGAPRSAMDESRQSLFFPPSLKNIYCVFCGSEKLPFAGYSVVKDHPGEQTPRETFGGRGVGSPGPPRLAHSRGPQCPAPFARPETTTASCLS